MYLTCRHVLPVMSRQRSGVVVNNSSLAAVMATPRITSRMKAKFGDGYEEALNERNKIVPMGSMGDAWDVANAVAFLASDAAKYITATELVVDGGLSASALGHPWADDQKNL